MSTPNPLNRLLVETLSRLRNQRVWHAFGGEVHGATIGLDIGRRRKRAVPLTNPRVSEEVRRYEGQFGLFVTCAWRLELESRVVCSSESEEDDGRDIAEGMANLIGRVIVDVQVDERTFDLALTLRPEARLSVFCDEVDEGACNYDVTLRDSLLIVGPKSVVRREARTHSYRPLLRLV